MFDYVCTEILKDYGSPGVTLATPVLNSLAVSKPAHVGPLCPTKPKDLNSLECETEKNDFITFFICPAKLIIGRTLEIWQLDVLVMKIIFKNNKTDKIKL